MDVQAEWIDSEGTHLSPVFRSLLDLRNWLYYNGICLYQIYYLRSVS